MSSGATTRAENGAGVATSPADLAEKSRRMLEEAFNEGKFDLSDELTAPDAVMHDPALPPRLRHLRGPALGRELVNMYRSAFPDVRLTVDDVIASDDKVTLRWHSEGTHKGELEGMAPTGAHGSVTGISIDRWQDGKLVESWAEWDNLGLARQVGAAPPEGSIGEKLGIRMQRLMARRMRRKNPI